MVQAATYSTDTSDMLIPHGLFRSVFDSAAGVVDAVPAGDSERVAAVHSYFDNVLRFLDAHHGGEDAIIWPLLTERCPEAHALIGRMEQEHDGIHRRRDAAGEALEAWYSDVRPETGDALRGALAGLRLDVERHFTEEERDVLPLASRNMSPEEWGGLPGHAMAHFSGDKIWLILGLIFEQMTPEQLAFTFTLLPPPVVEMWQTSGRAAFEDFIATVRGRA